MDHSDLLWATPTDLHQTSLDGLRELANSSLNLARQIMQHTREGIVVMDPRGRVIGVNPAFCRLSELDAADIEGRHITNINHDLHERRYYRQIWQRLLQQGHWQGEVQHHTRQGRLATHWLMLHLLRDGRGRVSHIIGILDDISRLKQSEEKLSYLAHHDALTGTANRSFLLSWFNKVRLSLDEGEQLALLFIDLDRFKPINDSFGHGVGDQVLKALAGRLLARVDANELVARIGGDEFVMIWRGRLSTGELLAKAEQLLEELEAPVLVGEYELSVGASIGVSLYPEHGLEIETLLRYADTAMYEAKTFSSAKVCLFDSAQFARLEQQHRLAGEFRLAIERRQLFLEYQPKLELSSRRLLSLEALLRWRHPELGVLYPDQFLPAAKDAGLLCRLADWVFGEAARQYRCWREQGGWQGRVSINLNGLELEQHRAAQLLDIFARERVSPSDFILELRSDFIMRRSESLMGALHAFRSAGMAVYLDNVGEGRLSFSKLRQLPIDGIKIDRSLLSDHFDPLDRSVIRSLLLLSQTLGIEVVACGVETAEQMQFLHQHGCSSVQGQLLAAPMTAGQLEAFYRNASDGLRH
ncbi:PAS domain S-box protein [Zobellella denitrificans]|uniref:putative bifunctional diguanylate cyclase/phosphodiesterase n=1 Tax=Zobellella denitrificans TaxID=347534 RepID=UPI000B8C3416|nr:EAL domain-containing protein [Zobellella denitrificans]OXS15159.1 PAS domain S-box protein [Zobellella denitrificans]